LTELKSITKSTFISEGLKVLEQISSKKHLDYQTIINNVDLNKNSESTRNTCLGQIKKRYLDFNDDNELSYSAMLKLFNNNIILKKELMYLNYIYTEPTFRKLIVEIIYPKLLQNNGEVNITRKELVNFLNQHLKYKQVVIKKTASSSVKALIDFDLAGAEGKEIKINYYQPELKTFVYALYNEYSRENSKYNNFNILNPSLDHIKEKADFPKFLLINPSFIDSFLQSAWKAGYLSYEPRGGLNQYVLKHNNIESFADYIVNEEE
jgi:hypothetical protein